MNREEALAGALHRHYGIDAASVGVLAGVLRYLVKVRAANGSRDVAAAVSRHLAETGVPHIVAPIRSTPGSLTVCEGDLSLTVYLYIDGGTGVEAGLDSGIGTFGDLVRLVHASVLPAGLADQVATETYRPAELDVVRRVDAAVSGGGFADRVAADAAAVWAANHGAILALVKRTEELGPQAARLSLPLVLCHADLHTWNVIIDGDGELWVIDRDEVVRAPKERDLMFVVGDTAVDPLALSYYRHAWAVQDIGGFGERVFLTPGLGDESRSEAARILTGLFGPGEIVELALAEP